MSIYVFDGGWSYDKPECECTEYVPVGEMQDLVGKLKVATDTYRTCVRDLIDCLESITLNLKHNKDTANAMKCLLEMDDVMRRVLTLVRD